MKKLFFIALLIAEFVRAANGVLVVTNTNNSGAGSLRQAILDANSDPLVPHIIQFSIGSGVQTIQPTTALPAITAPYTYVDGTTQPGWSVGNPQIVLSGASASFSFDGLVLSGVHNCVIHGLVINGGFDNGILITDGGIGSHHNAVIDCLIGTNQAGTAASPNNNGIAIIGSSSFSNFLNTIGGETDDQRNIISGNNNAGIYIAINAVSNFVRNNYIGTNKAGTAAIGNANTGVTLLGSTIPSSSEQANGNVVLVNLISGNGVAGILLGANTLQSYINLNVIGLDAAGTSPLPNDVGIKIEGVVPPDPFDPSNGAAASNTFIDNVISGNSSHGVFLSVNSINNSFDTNTIGMDVLRTFTSLGNGGHGILIQGTTDAPSSSNIIGTNPFGNVIAYSGSGAVGTHNGIRVGGDPTTPDILNAIFANEIFNNTGNGIELVNNGNDMQAAPTLVNALVNADGNAVTIAATAPSTPANTLFRIDFFLNSVDRSPITEGENFIGYVDNVPSGETIVQRFALNSPISGNLWASATATDLNNFGRPGNTSEFTSNLLTVTLVDNIPSIMFPGF